METKSGYSGFFGTREIESKNKTNMKSKIVVGEI